MKKKIPKIQVLRVITQIVFLFLFPALITLTFGELKQIYLIILKGKFNFIQSFPKLMEVIVILPLTILLGRFFCGWFCAFGAFNDFIYIISNKIFKIKFKVSRKVDSVLKYLKYLILLFIIVVIWIGGNKLFDSSSPWDAFAQISQFSEAIYQYTLGFVILGLIAVGAMFIERFFCRYLCPLGAVFALTSRFRILKIDKPSDKCGNCRMCTNNCAMGIQLSKMKKVSSGECINCFKCLEACPRKNAQVSLCNENINPVLVSAVAITAFAGIYSISSTLGDIININNLENKASISVNKDTSVDNTKVVNSSPVINSTPTANNNSKSSVGKIYKDGTYIGVGSGFRSGLQVAVTIKQDKITNIEVLSNNETPRYSSEPINIIPNEII